MAKGHILREEDIRVLQSEGMQQIWVTQLEEGEDTRIRREVVGQMLDYAANAVVYWPPDRIGFF